MEESESGMDSYMDLMMTNAMLDCEMQCLKSKIQSRNDENTKMESQINELIKKISQLEKSIQSSLDRESKIKNNIYSLQNSRCISEGLVMSMKHELRISQGKRAETKSTRNKIVQKYSEIFQSYRNVYKGLPWIQKNYELKISTEIGRIKLNILKSEYSSYKKKLALFHKIGEQRMIIAIVNFAKLMVEKNNYQKDLSNIANQIASSEANIIKLKEEKLRTLEKIDLKVKAALAEARERAAKAQTSLYAENPKQWVSSTPFSSSFSTSRESIFSRLGLGGPLTLKRPLPFKPSIPEKVSRTMDTLYHLDGVLKAGQKDNEKANKSEGFNSSSIQFTPENCSSNRTDKLLPFKRSEKLSTSVNNVTKLPHTSDTEKVSSENIIQNSGNECKAKDKIPEPTKSQKNTDGTLSATDRKKPLSMEVSPTKVSSDNDSIAEEIEKKKKKLKKKTKKVSTEKTKVESKSKSVEKKVTFFTEEVKKDDKQNEVVETKVVSPEKQKEDCAEVTDIPIHNENNQDLAESHKDDIEQSAMCADISIDTDSVLSNFNMENRDDISERNLDSPDFFIQRPQGYCFSPPFGQTSSPVGDKHDKGNKQPIYEFGDSPAMSPLFPVENQKKTSGGPSTSFADFFGSSSPKKSNQSTKSFFQLFG